MRIGTLIIAMIFFTTSCMMNKDNKSAMNKNEHNDENRTAEMNVEDYIFVIPQYINTSINCISRPRFAETEKLKPQIVVSYFSEYSSIHFFTKITPKQIIFETFNETGTPKPNLIFYVDDLEKAEYQKIFDFFKKEKTYEDWSYTHDSGQHMMIKDKAKNELGEMWQGDKYPLTKLEGNWLVKRHLEYFSQIGKFNIEFKEELLRPVFFNLCRHEEEFIYWKELYPEIQNHELKY